MAARARLSPCFRRIYAFGTSLEYLGAKERRCEQMQIKSVALGLIAVVATAAPVFAWSGGGGQSEAHDMMGPHAHDGKISGKFPGGTYQGTYANGQFSGTYTLSAAEPLSALAVALGLLGTRYVRRRS
jgi:hypothetical protein